MLATASPATSSSTCARDSLAGFEEIYVHEKARGLLPRLQLPPALEAAAAVLLLAWRAAQVATIGAGPLALSLWQTLTLLAILFHHANVRLPIALERALVRVFMTPRLHGIRAAGRRIPARALPAPRASG